MEKLEILVRHWHWNRINKRKLSDFLVGIAALKVREFLFYREVLADLKREMISFPDCDLLTAWQDSNRFRY